MLPFTTVENSNFRALFPNAITSAESVKRWIEELYETRKIKIKEILKNIDVPLMGENRNFNVVYMGLYSPIHEY